MLKGMALQKCIPLGNPQSVRVKPTSFSAVMLGKAHPADADMSAVLEDAVDIDLREIYFLIMHFLSSGPCHRTYGQLWNELLEHNLLPRRFHAWYSRTGKPSGDENDDGLSFPLSYSKLVERYPHIEKDHLVKLLKQLILRKSHSLQGTVGGIAPSAADVPTLLGTGPFSLLSNGKNNNHNIVKPPIYMRWPHMQADQVCALRLREIGGGFTRHHRAPSSRAACYAIAKPTTMVQKMQNIKKTRGHRNAVYCAMLDCSGRFVITGSDDRLVKIWSMETAYCLASCRGHEGDITDLAVSSNNALVASSSNDCIIRVWRLPDGLPISVLRGHTGAVTAIAFSPRPSAVYQLLSSSDDGTCRLWDARYSQFKPRIYVPRPSDSAAGKSGAPSSSSGQQNHQIFCCAFNASGTVFVTGSSDTLARVWNACKTCTDNSEQPNHEMDVLSGHENDVNYVQFSGCTVASRFSSADAIKEDSIPKFRNSWFAHDNIVTCSRDGSAIIWIPKSRKSHGKAGRWTRAYHLKVPPPPMPPQPPRGGPRHRVLPTPRGVNMIVWSLDNRFVLAAIMDCRICVWNAADGSLVHSLTGHTESTYVLDVHPFNPRIAMSAGYDGKTILWDIWEGRPIKVYEIARFKLVDGKFSPDGTSIILSDDVGQLYILSTGQGESQKDAQYDQFFLGDYRPLIQDTYGNVVDQETQLAPYRRNMQDLLCDSTMIPYPEPYQSMYQQRRLGALGIEWRPSSVRFAVGPDFNSNQDFQIMPLADLDIVIDPLPEFVDAMDWEPEVEVQTDDSDTEFIITEEFSIGAEDGSLSSTTSGGLESDAEDSEGESGHKDGLRRSRRKNKKRDVEMTTSSGRRVKRSRVDEYGDNAHRLSQARNYRTGRKVSKKKKVSSKSLRPQRAAARNALSLFSKIKGLTPGREDQDGSEADFSECESTEDSTFESEDSDKSPQVEQEKFSKGKEVILDDSEDAIKADYLHESHGNSGNKRNMLLRLQIREPNRSLDSDGLRIKPEEAGCVGSSSKASCDKHVKNLKPQDNGLLTGVYCDGIGKWGGVRARSSKRLRSAETMPAKVFSRSNASANGQLEIENGSVRHVNPAAECGLLCVEHVRTGNSEGSDDTNIKEHDRCNGFNDFNEPTDQTNVTSGDQDQRSIDNDHKCDFNQPMRLRIKSKRTSSPSSPSMLNFTSDARYGDADACPPDCEIQPCFLQQSSAEDMENVHGCNMEGMNSGYLKGVENSNGLSNGSSSPALPDSQDMPSRKIDRMYSAVYRRSKSSRSKVNSEGDGHCKGESTSNISNQNLNSCTPIDDGATNGAWAHSMRPGSTSLEISEEVEGLSLNRNDERSCDAWGSRMTLGLRSARNRRNSYVRDTSPVDRRKSNQSQKKLSWLMLSTPEGSRYIPQHGDDVVYLRQGHQEYMYGSRFSDQGPWECLKGQIRAVEFCKVKGLEYSTLPGSGDSCCKMTLEFVDSCSDVCGKRFKLTLPEVITFPDFIVERTRYEAAVQRNWSARDKCQVWWKNEGEEDGSWWEGRILGSKAKSAEFPDSPWERFIIRYKSDPGETHLHSPWELYDADTQWEQPRIDDGTREKLLASLVKLEQSGNRSQDNYGVKKLKQVAQKTSFLNRFPVPLSLDVIQSRLENNYYRSLEAMKHDVEVMLRNVEVYFGKNAELSAKMKRLSDWFARKLSSLKQ